MNKGQTVLQLAIGVGAGITTIFFGWNAWLSSVAFDTSKNLAAINEHLSNIDQKLEKGSNSDNVTVLPISLFRTATTSNRN